MTKRNQSCHFPYEITLNLPSNEIIPAKPEILISVFDNGCGSTKLYPDKTGIFLDDIQSKIKLLHGGYGITKGKGIPIRLKIAKKKWSQALSF